MIHPLSSWRTALRLLAPLLLISLAPAATLDSGLSGSASLPGPINAINAGDPGESVELETFDAVWDTIYKEHFDPTFNGVDWKAVRKELRPRAREAATNEELREVVRDMLGRLEQSHFALIPKEALPEAGRGTTEADEDRAAGVGLDVRLIDERAWVTRVDPDSPADRAGVRTGWFLTSIDGKDLEELTAEADSAADERERRFAVWRLLNAATFGPLASRVTIGFEDGEGAAHELELERVERDVLPFVMGGGLPTFYLRSEHVRLEERGVQIGVLSFSNWFQPIIPKVNAAMREFRGCDGIVIDLRGNTGGNGGLVAAVAGHFFEKRVLLGTQKMRRGKMDYRASPRHFPFDGPLAILTDNTTGSTSEVFTGGMQSVGRARVFGQTTAGAVLPARTRSLPNGDSLLYAIGDFRTALGALLEGSGVEPDFAVNPDRRILLEGRDAVLEEALDWIVRQRGV